MTKEERLKEIRERIADYWFVDNPNGDEIVWLCEQLDLANKRIEVLRTACERISEKGEDYTLDAILDWDGVIDQARIALKAADEVK